MATPKESKSELLRLITANGAVSLAQVRDFARQPGIDFGPGIDVIDVILAYRDLGKINVDTLRKTVSAS